jgi:predicted dienelactone hydrolase
VNPSLHSNPPSNRLQSSVARRFSKIQGLLCGIALTFGMATPGQAAERISVRFGPMQQAVAIADLQKFASTGKVPSSLQLLTPFLTTEVRQALNTPLQLDPNIGDKLVEDLLHSSAGERFLNTLQVAIPDSNATQLQQALTQAAKQPDQMSLLGFLESFPAETVTIDAPSVIALASQINLPYWQSQTLSSIVDRELTVESKLPESELKPEEQGPYWVWQQSMVMRDYKRDRSIPVDLYWSRETQGPLVVLSHGFGADRRFLTYLARHLASHGLTVVALEHPGSNVAWLTSNALDQSATNSISSLLPATEFVDRPKDVSFVLDRLSTLDRLSLNLRGKFNTNEVTIIGHSLGGYTALALAGAKPNLKRLHKFCADPNPVVFSPADLLQCNAADLPDTAIDLQDARIKQAVILNPMMGRLFDATGLAQVQVPILMVASTDDAITPAVSQQFLPFTQLTAPRKYLLTAIGGTHLSVGDPTNLNHALTESMFVRERSAAETEPLRNLLQGVSLAFIKQMTPEAKQYAPFLNPAYAQSFSTESLKLRLNADLPPSLSNWLKLTALPMEQLVARTLPTRKAEGLCRDNLGCLFHNSMPLVMFILPGGFPLLRHPLRQFKYRRRKSAQRNDT